MLTATRRINQRTDQVQLHVAPEVTDAGAITPTAESEVTL
jgi:hypothetical protein